MCGGARDEETLMRSWDSPYGFKLLKVLHIAPNSGTWNHRNLRTGQYWHLTLGFQEHQGLCGKLDDGPDKDVYVLSQNL